MQLLHRDREGSPMGGWPAPVARGPVPRECSYCIETGRALLPNLGPIVFWCIQRSRGTGPRATVFRADCVLVHTSIARETRSDARMETSEGPRATGGFRANCVPGHILTLILLASNRNVHRRGRRQRDTRHSSPFLSQWHAQHTAPHPSALRRRTTVL